MTAMVKKPRAAPSSAPATDAKTATEKIQPEPSKSFLAELQESWAQHGAAMIEQVREDRPQDYLRLIASTLAKQPDGESDAIDAMSDEEVAEELRTILDRLDARSAGAGTGAGAAEEA